MLRYLATHCYGPFVPGASASWGRASYRSVTGNRARDSDCIASIGFVKTSCRDCVGIGDWTEISTSDSDHVAAVCRHTRLGYTVESGNGRGIVVKRRIVEINSSARDVIFYCCELKLEVLANTRGIWAFVLQLKSHRNAYLCYV
jgi:hypothetical protein